MSQIRAIPETCLLPGRQRRRRTYSHWADKGSTRMRKSMLVGVGMAAALAVLATGAAISAQDKYTVKVPGGLALSEFRGYESWEFISASYTAPDTVAVTLGNPLMIQALKAGIPDNGQLFPDGAKMAKIHYNTQKHE